MPVPMPVPMYRATAHASTIYGVGSPDRSGVGARGRRLLRAAARSIGQTTGARMNRELSSHACIGSS
jgi:hypothetical protein